MRAVFALVLVLGLALAGAAVFLAQSYMGQTEAALARATESARKTGKLVQVYATKTAMAFGSPLTKDDVQLIYVQEKFLPQGAFVHVPETATKPAAAPKAAAPAASGSALSTKEQAAAPTAANTPASEPLFPTDTDKPRFLSRSVEPNEILLASRLTAPGESASLAGKLDRGMRAFQIQVDVASGLSNMILPDSYIDIYWTGTSSSNLSGEVTRMIESAILVIAVDNATGEGQSTGGRNRTVTVAANPEQVALLAQAQATGRLAMSLVASADDVVDGLIEVDRDKLLGVEKAPVVEAEVAAPQVCTIRTRKGDQIVDVPIPCTN